MTGIQLASESRQVLIDTIGKVISKSPVHSLAFALRVCNTEIAQETGLADFLNKAVWDVAYGGYPEVAAMGFQIAARTDERNSELVGKFLDGLRRQKGRPDKALEALSLDDVALLGFAEGIAVIQKTNQTPEIESLKQWILDLINLEPRRELWTSRLRDLAGDLLDKKGRLRSLPNWSELNFASLEIVLRDLWQGQQMNYDILPMEFFGDLLSSLIKNANPKTSQIEELVVRLKAMDLLIEQNSKSLFPKADIALSMLGNIKHRLDLVAIRNTKISMLLGFLVLVVINISYYFAKTNLAQNIQNIFDYFVPFLSASLVYVYYAVSQKELSPKEIYIQMLEKHKDRLYKKWGLDIEKLPEIQKM